MTRIPCQHHVPDELVRRAAAGDRTALEELVDRVYPRVRRWCLVHTGDAADADDLTQDVLVRMIRRLRSFRGDARFTSWLYRLTRNVAADAHRGRARRRRMIDTPGADRDVRPGASPDPHVAAEAAWTADLLRGFFAELPPRQREVFDLSELQGWATADIAEALDIEPVSVRAHLFKARRTLRARILEHHPHLDGADA